MATATALEFGRRTCGRLRVLGVTVPTVTGAVIKGPFIRQAGLEPPAIPVKSTTWVHSGLVQPIMMSVPPVTTEGHFTDETEGP